MTKRHPIQPIVDVDGIHRFQTNEIVRFLLDAGPFDLNQLALKDFSPEDWEQFAQLIGYSVSGFGDLSYASPETVAAADLMAEGKDEKDARIEELTNRLNGLRDGAERLVAELQKLGFCK